ncbi:MAG: c-type cytochrome [Sulfuricurvum sp.]
MNWKLPFDIPLVVPTMGLPGWFFDALGVIVFVVHIAFIYTLIGASTASVLYNITGVFKKSKTDDDLAYAMTNPTTISENMGALWGVAPLLVISVLYTGFFYTAILKVSPHILHIIYGNIFAFLLSYAYKFSWHGLHHHKGFHIAIGLVAVLTFYTLPPVFMSMANLYLQPETFATVNNIWDIMFTPLTGFRLLNFYLTAFSFTGVFMIYMGAKWAKQGGDKAAVGRLAIDQGKKWFMWAAPVNIAVLPLVFFAFTPRISEAYIHTPFVFLPFLASIVLTILFFFLLKRFGDEEVNSTDATKAMALMLIAVALMATARHGIRVVSFEEPLALQAKATEEYMNNVITEYNAYKEEMKNAPAVTVDPAEALADSKGCLACHSVDTRLVGPAYKEVAAKGGSVEVLMESIKNGSTGKWGDVPMPPQSVSDEEAKTLIEWVLKQK